MKKITGDISLMSLPDLMQWADTGRKSGTLTITNNETRKTFYLQDGKLIFVSSRKEGERLGEFFTSTGCLNKETIDKSLKESIRLSVPFTGYLISEKIIEKKSLEMVLERLSEKVFTDALQWDSGTFEFTDTLPPLILNGPVMLNTSFMVFQSVKLYDESRRNKKEKFDAGDLLINLTEKIKEGNIEIPPIPDIMHKLTNHMQKDDIAIHDIVKIIMSDQILTSKILKVVNSAFYSPAEEITSLQQAIYFMGLKSILSIVTFHSLGGSSIRHSDRIKSILQHSLLCAFIAKKIANSMRIDPEEAFVCALLHDIGKTVLINLISDPSLPADIKNAFIADYHAGVGFMVASKWNLSEVIRYSIKFHHNPKDAALHKKTVETIYLADIIANTQDIQATMKTLPENCENIDFDRINDIFGELEGIKQTVTSII